MVKAPQAACLQLGRTGCYFLSMCFIAEEVAGKPIDALKAYYDCLAAGCIGPDAYVQDAGKVMSLLTGERWTCLKSGPRHELPDGYCPRPGEREILRFERKIPQPKAENAHFVVGDGSGRVLWDPMGMSGTVSYFMASKRIFRRVQ